MPKSMNTGLPVSSTAHLTDEARGKSQEVPELSTPLIENGFSMG